MRHTLIIWMDNLFTAVETARSQLKIGFDSGGDQFIGAVLIDSSDMPQQPFKRSFSI